MKKISLIKSHYDRAIIAIVYTTEKHFYISVALMIFTVNFFDLSLEKCRDESFIPTGKESG